MALFSFPLPTTTRDQLENLYNICGVDRSIVLDLASDFETPETVWGGYCRAYLSFFETCGIFFDPGTDPRDSYGAWIVFFLDFS